MIPLFSRYLLETTICKAAEKRVIVELNPMWS